MIILHLKTFICCFSLNFSVLKVWCVFQRSRSPTPFLNGFEIGALQTAIRLMRWFAYRSMRRLLKPPLLVTPPEAARRASICTRELFLLLIGLAGLFATDDSGSAFFGSELAFWILSFSLFMKCSSLKRKITVGKRIILYVSSKKSGLPIKLLPLYEELLFHYLLIYL